MLLAGTYTALVHKAGYEVARRELHLSAGKEYEEFFELRPAPARSEPLEIDVYELAERQMQLLEQEVVVRGNLKLAGEYGKGWESARSDYFAFEIEGTTAFPGGERLRRPLVQAYAEKGEPGTELYRRLRRADPPVIPGKFVLIIPLRHFTVSRRGRSPTLDVHGELVRWVLDES
jgi:hypothetical protein